MSGRWVQAVVTLDDLCSFREHVEAQRNKPGNRAELPSRLTIRGAAYRAVKERFILGDIPSDPRHAARGLDGTVTMFWREPAGRGANLLRQTAQFFSDMVLNNSTRRAAGLVAGLYGSVVSDSDYTLVLELNAPAAMQVDERQLAMAS